jgi:exodeoxyribonuclease VII small subunit
VPDGPAAKGLTTIAHPFSSAQMPRATAPAETQPLSYEDALAELDRLVQRMETGQMPLDQMLDGYRRGAELLALCRSRLSAIEEQVRVLEQGELKPWAAETGE